MHFVNVTNNSVLVFGIFQMSQRYKNPEEMRQQVWKTCETARLSPWTVLDLHPGSSEEIVKEKFDKLRKAISGKKWFDAEDWHSKGWAYHSIMKLQENYIGGDTDNRSDFCNKGELLYPDYRYLYGKKALGMMFRQGWTLHQKMGKMYKGNILPYAFCNTPEWKMKEKERKEEERRDMERREKERKENERREREREDEERVENERREEERKENERREEERKEEERKEKEKNVKCYRCNEMGHYGRNCPAPYRAPGSRSKKKK